MERITRQVVQYISDMEKKAKQMSFVKKANGKVCRTRQAWKTLKDVNRDKVTRKVKYYDNDKW